MGVLPALISPEEVSDPPDGHLPDLDDRAGDIADGVPNRVDSITHGLDHRLAGVVDGLDEIAVVGDLVE